MIISTVVRWKSCVLSVVSFALLYATRADAQYQARPVEVEGDREAHDDVARPTDALANLPFVTVIDARAPTARTASVADLIEHEAGVRLRSQGGLGAFTSVSIRGSESSQVAVYLDGVPLSRASTGTLDLSQLSADGLERIEIYRGGAPPEFGSEAIGGVIHLVSRKGQKGSALRASVGGGSFGARSLSLGRSERRGAYRSDVSLGYRGATGDFLYYDNGGTLLTTLDDKSSRRSNNGFDQLSLDATFERRGALTYSLGAHGFWKRQGVPGIGTAGGESTRATLETGRVIVQGRIEGRARRAKLSLGGHTLVERVGFSNPIGDQVGFYGPRVSEGLSIATNLQGRADVPLGKHQVLAAFAELRVEGRYASDLLRPSMSSPPSNRVIFGAAIFDELRLAHDRLALEPALRLDVARSAIHTASEIESTTAAAATQVFVSPRLGVRVRATSWLSFKGSAGRFVRFPTLIELFGDGAFLLGRPSLRAEDAWGGDLGFVVAGKRGIAEGALEYAFFGRHVGDLISLAPVAYASSALNIGSARVLGNEARARAGLWKTLFFSVAYTFVDALNQTTFSGAAGNQLPLRPRHDVTARAELTRGPFRLGYEVNFLDAVYRDPQNYNRLPARTLHAITLTVCHGPFSLDVELRNLADLRVTRLPLGGSAQAGASAPYPLVDSFDYPLPGRALYATLSYRP